jgi:hypothetical protein
LLQEIACSFENHFFAAPSKNVPLKKFMLENVSFFENRVFTASLESVLSSI